MPDTTYIIHGDKIPPHEKDAFRDTIKDAVVAGWMTVVKTPKKAAPYSSTFEAFWLDCPFKTGKGTAWTAWGKALKRGATAEEIYTGIGVYIQAEESRKKAHPDDYSPLHPATWINGDRFRDEPGADLTMPKKSKLDVTCEMIAKVIGKPVQGHARVTLTTCLNDGMTRQQIMNGLSRYEEGKDLSNFFYKITKACNKGG